MMEPLEHIATEDSPGVLLDKDRNIFRITDRSLPENAYAFYKPVFEWLEKYTLDPNDFCELHIKLDYFNTATAKQLSKLFILLEIIKDKIVIKWHYFDDDVDMKSSGIRYAKLTKLRFEMIEEPLEFDDDDFKIIYE